MTRTDDYRYRAAEAVLVKSKHAMQMMQARRPLEAQVPSAGESSEPEDAVFDDDLYRETERALGLAAAALTELESTESEGEG